MHNLTEVIKTIIDNPLINSKAAVGGGAISADGGGIATGQAILDGIDTATTVVGEIDGVIYIGFK